MLKQQLKQRGCAGSQCTSGHPWAACWPSPRALVLTDDFSGTAEAREQAWHPMQCECWGPGGGRQLLTSFGWGYPGSGSNSKRGGTPRPGAAARDLPEKGGSVQTYLHLKGLVQAAPAQLGRGPSQAGCVPVFPGLWFPQGQILEKAGLWTTF